ncbi:MAG: sigma-70 family RNA polymerase sigma factor [Candidatus Moranbacteria bacterium]|nr:sigma-70 family RNA polymerase sigma factor [Candidatus Moranbacteria bacterium]
MEEMSDKELVDSFLEGDQAAFDLIVGRYFRAVFNFVYKITPETPTAEDITQEAFLKAWRNIRKYDTSRSFKTWIFTIAKNTAFDYLKKKKELSFSAFRDDEGNNFLENVGSGEPLPDEIIMKEDMPQKLEKAIEALPPKYKVVLNLRYKEYMSFPEIAEVMGESQNTVKSRHRRAVEALKKAISDLDATFL